MFACLVGNVLSQRVNSVRYAWDASFGEILEPGHHFVLWGEGDGSGLISAHGARVSGDRARTNEAGGATAPILVLGDSFAEALQVSDDELFSNLLARSLAADGILVRVVNAGRSAYSMADYACRAGAFRNAFAPKWVVVLLNEGDFAGDPFAPQNGHAGFRWQRGKLECVPPAIPPAPPSRDPLRYWAHEARAAVGLPDLLWTRLRARVAKDRDATPLFSAGQASTDGHPATPTQDAPIRAELSVLRAAWGERLTLLHLPPFDPESPAMPSAFELRLEQAARELGLRFLSLRAEYPSLAARRVLPYGFSNTRLNAGHCNREGHAATARLLHREFSRLRSHGLL